MYNYNKYLKYKKKYLELKNLIGGKLTKRQLESIKQKTNINHIPKIIINEEKEFFWPT
jgi:hypothetical protein